MALSVAGAALDAKAGPRDALAEAARAFDESALRDDDDNAKPSSVRKWMTSLRIAVRNGNGAPRLVQPAIKAVRAIAEVAGVAVSEVDAADSGANFIIYFDENESSGKRDCRAFPRWQNWALVHAEVKINPTFGGLLDYCLIHEPMHAFGFLSHPHGADSVLSYVYHRKALTPLDINLIKTLYDPALKVGMPPAAASQQACRLLAGRLGSSDADRQAVCDGRTVVMRTPTGEVFEQKRSVLGLRKGPHGSCGARVDYPIEVYPNKVSFSFNDGWHTFAGDAAGAFAGSFTNTKNGSLYRLSGNLRTRTVTVENATLGCVWDGPLY